MKTEFYSIDFTMKDDRMQEMAICSCPCCR